MANGYIIGRSAGVIGLRDLFRRLSTVSPDAALTGDYYADRLDREAEIAEHLGISPDSPVLASTRSADARLGPVTSLVVPLSESLQFAGRFSSSGITLNANRHFSHVEIEPLCDCLRSLGMELDIYRGE